MRQFIFLVTVLMIGILTCSPTDSISAHSSTDSVRMTSEQPYNKQELIIQFKQNTALKTKNALLNSISAVETEKLANHQFSLLTLPEGNNLEVAAKSLLSHPEILSAEPNYKMAHTYIPTDPDYSKQWYLKDLNLLEAWDLPKGKAVIKVAVIDGGVQANHIDLKGKITQPFNVITRKKTLLPNDHGTHIAGVIAAVHNNEGTAGIAPSSKIIPVNVFNGDEADIFDVAEGIYYAMDAGADIINLSLTTNAYTNILDEAVQAAAARGVIIIAAAGNEHTAKLRYPAALKNVLGISAIDKKEKITSFSNFGKYIDFTAPGMDIYSSVSESNYEVLSGTSMASPMVAGITALILAKNPFLSPSELTSILKKSSSDLGPEGWDPQYGFGKIDAYKSLINTPYHMSSINLSDDSFTIDGSKKLTISFNTAKDTFVSLYAEDSNGNVIKKMLTNKSSTGDTITYNWNGKLDNGAYHSSGTVKLVVKTGNARHSLIKTKTLSLKNMITPEVTLIDSAYLYSPKVSATISIPFNLNKAASIQAFVIDSNGQRKRTLYNKKLFQGGKQSIVWNGKDSAKHILSDGTYILNVFLKDEDGYTGKTQKIPITLDTKSPAGSFTNSSNLFKMTGKSTIQTSVNVKENVTATVSIIDNNGKLIKKLLTDKSFKAGRTSVIWNGQGTNKNSAKNGNYRFKVILKDAAGNTRIIKSSAFKLLNA